MLSLLSIDVDAVQHIYVCDVAARRIKSETSLVRNPSDHLTGFVNKSPTNSIFALVVLHPLGNISIANQTRYVAL